MKVSFEDLQKTPAQPTNLQDIATSRTPTPGLLPTSQGMDLYHLNISYLAHPFSVSAIQPSRSRTRSPNQGLSIYYFQVDRP